jgi:hypothetical protein
MKKNAPPQDVDTASRYYNYLNLLFAPNSHDSISSQLRNLIDTLSEGLKMLKDSEIAKSPNLSKTDLQKKPLENNDFDEIDYQKIAKLHTKKKEIVNGLKKQEK